jgi:hypothetical protein
MQEPIMDAFPLLNLGRRQATIISLRSLRAFASAYAQERPVTLVRPPRSMSRSARLRNDRVAAQLSDWCASDGHEFYYWPSIRLVCVRISHRAAIGGMPTSQSKPNPRRSTSELAPDGNFASIACTADLLHVT